ncbi:galactonate dehydratase [bacterium SCSIO 12827]|nr:galactonate dehydratase [bacterium SCSIO 12827]
MKITKITPKLISKYLFVEIETDAGITGLGECGSWGQLEAAQTAVEKFADYLIGKDPGPIEHHWNVMHRFSHFRGAAICGAISAIDIALWDIKGQALGQPIHALLGGPTRTKARVYGHVKAETKDEMVANCKKMQELGFTAIGHFNPFLDEDRDKPYYKSHARKIEDAVAVVAAVREACGPDLDLCIEIHRRLTPAEAVVFAQELAPLRPMFYEDPIRPDSHDAMARVKDRISIPLATGERFNSIYDFQALLTREGVDYVRISACLCGGITGARKIAALAEAHDVQVIPHNPLSPVCLFAELQLDAAIPNFAIQEYPTVGVGFEDKGTSNEPGTELADKGVVTNVPTFKDGFVDIPTAPGLGVKLAPGAAEKFPPFPRKVRMRPHADGFIVDQ